MAAFTQAHQLTATDQAWYAGDIVWAGGNGTVNLINTVATTMKGNVGAATCGP